MFRQNLENIVFKKIVTLTVWSIVKTKLILLINTLNQKMIKKLALSKMKILI